MRMNLSLHVVKITHYMNFGIEILDTMFGHKATFQRTTPNGELLKLCIL